ncbi:hypothetical protein [Nocardia sp. NPDC005825]|uniref:hypothetical protein n=1 Tax=unclassified Nocardia TaxID=2637762 RepID=UPI0033E11F33
MAVAGLWDEFLSGERNFEYGAVLIHADMSIDHVLGLGAGAEFVRRVQEYCGRAFDILRAIGRDRPEFRVNGQAGSL